MKKGKQPDPKTMTTIVPKPDGSFCQIIQDAPANESRQARRMRERKEKKNGAKLEASTCSEAWFRIPIILP